MQTIGKEIEMVVGDVVMVDVGGDEHKFKESYQNLFLKCLFLLRNYKF